MLVRMLQDMGTIKRLLGRAEEEARAMGDEVPGPEHLLLAALALPDGTALAAFAAVGIDEESFRSALSGAHQEALPAVGIDPGDESGLPDPAPGAGPYRSTAPAKQTFRMATRLSKKRRPRALLGGHVVAAASDQAATGTLGRALDMLGLSPDELRAAGLDAAR